STGMTMLNAIGSSLVAVTAFGLTTALSYAFSGLVDWPLAALFVAGGVVGGLLGSRAAVRLAGHKGALNVAFAGLVLVVAVYMAANTFSSVLKGA
ncbi:TSUP family transporter, partial [Devosia sp.]|uniref:TSUP family transporter n=1 Tax=Devosia sp. TaxID=1871048 RepID=UPI003264976F